jgi:hypothetical protein
VCLHNDCNVKPSRFLSCDSKLNRQCCDSVHSWRKSLYSHESLWFWENEWCILARLYSDSKSLEAINATTFKILRRYYEFLGLRKFEWLSSNKFLLSYVFFRMYSYINIWCRTSLVRAGLWMSHNFGLSRSINNFANLSLTSSLEAGRILLSFWHIECIMNWV